MKIAVIIPTYNRGSLIGQTLDSVLRQTRLPEQIIVADDGSTDQTRDIVAGYGDRVIYVSQPQTGHCAARNLGFEHSAADAVCFLDSDDLLLPGALAALEQALEQHPEAGLAYTRAQIIDHDGTLRSERWQIDDYQGDVWAYIIRRNFIMSPGCTLVRSRLLEAVGRWDTALKNNVDWDVWMRLAEMTSFVRVDTPLFQYRRHEGNLSGNTSKMYRGTQIVYAKHLKRHRNDRERYRATLTAMEATARHDSQLLVEQALHAREQGDDRLALSKLILAMRLYPRNLSRLRLLRFFLGTCKQAMIHRAFARS